jgi:hypothetical protein
LAPPCKNWHPPAGGGGPKIHRGGPKIFGSLRWHPPGQNSETAPVRGCTFSAFSKGQNRHKIFEKKIKYSKILLFLKKRNLRVKNAKNCLKDDIFTRNQIIIYFYK